MRYLRLSWKILWVFMLFWLIVPGYVGSEVVVETVKVVKSEPMVIKSKTLEVDDKSKIVTFLGNVNARKDDLIIDCQKMLVYYENRASQDGREKIETRVDRIVATGNVSINRTQGGKATAEQAVYYQGEEKVVLTGKPMVKQG